MAKTLRQVMEDDLALIFNTEHGTAVPARYESFKGDGLKDIKVLFDTETLEPDPRTGDLDVTAPMAWARTSDVPNARHKDKLTIEGVIYEVVKPPKPDGQGVTFLILGKTA